MVETAADLIVELSAQVEDAIRCLGSVDTADLSEADAQALDCLSRIKDLSSRLQSALNQSPEDPAQGGSQDDDSDGLTGGTSILSAPPLAPNDDYFAPYVPPTFTAAQIDPPGRSVVTDQSTRNAVAAQMPTGAVHMVNGEIPGETRCGQKWMGRSEIRISGGVGSTTCKECKRKYAGAVQQQANSV